MAGMTDDLVKRLRELTQCLNVDLAIGAEAADRIEQLQAMLRNFLTLPMYREGCGCGFCVLVDDTRTTLGEKKDEQ
jgi:hypothetical protein